MREQTMGRRRALTGGAVVMTAAALASVGGLTIGATAAGASSSKPLTVMVTNDDGYSAPGLNAAVQALRALPNTKVIVVAPLTNQSGTGGKVTTGKLVATKGKTASGYPAIAVHGYPADTVTWAINHHGISVKPNLVVSGINFGQNTGPTASLSGTVGAARAAAADGIPAIATSQGINGTGTPNFSEAASVLVHWVQTNRNALSARKFKAGHSVALNVPTCPGAVRGPVSAPTASTFDGYSYDTVNCTSTVTSFPSDVAAFANGYAVLSPLGTASSTPTTTSTTS
jgi:5'-nucleotidase